jgi:hypothetical protein
MDTIDTQNTIGLAGQEEVLILELAVFGRPMGGWPATGLTLGQLRKKAEEIRLRDNKNFSRELING